MENVPKMSRQNRSICPPFSVDEYKGTVGHAAAFRLSLDQRIAVYPELFPDDIGLGYQLKEVRHSKKQDLPIRRILVSGVSYTVRPSFVMPYMTGMVSEVEKALFLRNSNVSFWALAYVFGRNPMYWFRMEQSLGRNSLVGTTVRLPEDIPVDLGADEKHTWIKGEKAYVATTVGNECILGASIAKDPGKAALTEAYGRFKDEAEEVNPEYSARTVNTDSWGPTQNTWRNLFPGIVLICCFLHIFIKIRDRSKIKFKEVFGVIAEKLWHCYKATTKGAFSQRVRRLGEWAKGANLPDVILKPINKLRENIAMFSAAYDFPGALRTSNMIDRLMQRMDRFLFAIQYFHGSLASAERSIRGWVLIHNFAPSNPATVKKHGGLESPAVRLNKHRYHENWLENLLILKHCAKLRVDHPNLLPINAFLG